MSQETPPPVNANESVGPEWLSKLQQIGETSQMPVYQPQPDEPEWRHKLRQIAENLSGRQRAIARLLVEPIDRYQDYTHPPEKSIIPPPGSRLEQFGWRGDMPLKEFLRPDGDLYQVLIALVGEDHANLASRILLNRAGKIGEFYAYPKPGDTYMPKFQAWREVAKPQFSENEIDYLQSFVGDMTEGFSMDKYFAALDLSTIPYPDASLSGPDALKAHSENLQAIRKYRRTGDPILEYYLDDPKLAPELLARIEKIPDRVSRYAIMPVLVKSVNPDAHRLAGEMLVDPDIPDEIRYDSVRSGRREAYFTIIDRVMRSDLAISHSAERAVCGWLGLNFDNINPEQLSAFFGLSGSYHHNPDQLRKALRSNQLFWIYMALWVLSQENVDTAMDACLDRVRNGTRQQKIIALFFADKLNESAFKVKIANAVFSNPANRDDATCLPLTVNLLLHAVNGGRYFLQVLNDGMQLAISMEEEAKGATPAPSSKELRQLFLGLKETADLMLANNCRDRGGHFAIAERHSIGFTLDDVFALMSNIASRDDERDPMSLMAQPKDPWGVTIKWGVEVTLHDFPATFPRKPDPLDDTTGNDNIRDVLCQYTPHMGKDVLSRFIKQVVRDGGASPVQRRTLVAAFGKVPDTVWRYVAKMPFSDDECQVLEDALTTGDGQTRRLLEVRLLLREPEGLGRSVKRLLVDADAQKRAAGQELLGVVARKKDSPEYKKIYDECLAAFTNSNAQSGTAVAFVSGEADGYGLYDPKQEKAHFDLPGLPDLTALDAGEKLFPVTADEIMRLIETHNRVLATNPVKIDKEHLYPIDPSLAEALREAFRKEGITSECLVVYSRISQLNSSRPNPIEDGPLLFKPILRVLNDVRRRLKEKGSDVWSDLEKWDGLDAQILLPRERYRLIRPMTLAVLSLPLDKLHVDGYHMLLAWVWRLEECAVDDAYFTDFFRIMYEWTSGREGNGFSDRLLRPADVVRGYRLKVLPENDFIRLLVQLGDDGWLFEELTDPVKGEELLRDTPELRALVGRVATRAAEIEAGRGELPTPLANLAGSLRQFDCSADLFVRLVIGLGDAKLDQHYDWERTRVCSGSSRQTMLSRLLLSSRPAPEETAETLARCLEGKGISRERLEEVTEFVPAWKSYIFSR